MIYRKAKMSDIPAIIELAVESVSIDPIPVKVDRAAMGETLRALLNPSHFLWVTEKDGAVVAAVAAAVQPGFWFERLQCSVLMYYSKEKGGGYPLLRKFTQWIKSRPAIKLAIVELEPNADPRLLSLFTRLGFARQSQNLSFVRGA